MSEGEKTTPNSLKSIYGKMNKFKKFFPWLLFIVIRNMNSFSSHYFFALFVSSEQGEKDAQL